MRPHAGRPLRWLALLALLAGASSAHAEEPYRDLVCSYSWDCEKAMRVAACESNLDPLAYSAGQYGLYQIHYASHAAQVGPDPSALYDPATNVRIAFDVYQAAGGWSPWPYCGAR